MNTLFHCIAISLYFISLLPFPPPSPPNGPGALRYLEENYHIDRMEMAGASAGALSVSLLATKSDLLRATELAHELGMEYQIWTRPLGKLSSDAMRCDAMRCDAMRCDATCLTFVSTSTSRPCWNLGSHDRRVAR